MGNPQVFIAQFGTGANINLLPLAAGQLAARFRQDRRLMAAFDLREIIFRRSPVDEIAARMENVALLGVSCFLWNTNHSLALAEAVKRRFPKAVIVAGGPALPKAAGIRELFFEQYPFVDVVALEEGEEVFAQVAGAVLDGKGYSAIDGIIYRDQDTGAVVCSEAKGVLDLGLLPSPYLDGTFDQLYPRYKDDFSGVILETNRGCPYRCAYCTWGSQSPQIREKLDDVVAREIEWVGRHGVPYIAMCDANFGIRQRDLAFVEMLAQSRRTYGVPKFISVSWVKNSSDKVLKMAELLKSAGIGFRVTLSLQSLNRAALKACNRSNIKRQAYDEIKRAYRGRNVYSYTELIFGLPCETCESYLDGIEKSLSSSLFDQLYVYPLFLFPNTEMASTETRKRHQIQTRLIECVYTKSKVVNKIKEYVEIVVGHNAMSPDEWIRGFVVGYLTLALHDDRLAFFLFHYLRKEQGLRIVDLVTFAVEHASPEDQPIMWAAIRRLRETAEGVVRDSRDHLLRPRTYDGIPFDPPEGIFLELILEKNECLEELWGLTRRLLVSHGHSFSENVLSDLLTFQRAVIADPFGPSHEAIAIRYNWLEYFGFAFNLPEVPLQPHSCPLRLRVADRAPSHGDSLRFLHNHFDIRGVPALNLLYDPAGDLVFPPVPMQHLSRAEANHRPSPAKNTE